MSTSQHRLPPLSPFFVAALDGFPALDLSLDTIDAARPLMAGDDHPALPDGVSFTDETTTTDDGHSIALRVYERTDSMTPGAAMLWIHGGGYVMGTYRNDADLIGQIVADTGALVIAADYRLAPEHPYPVPLEDCYRALLNLSERATERGIERVGFGGLSAGGGLAAALSLLVRERSEIAVDFVVLDSPMIDDRRVTVSSRHDDIPVWTADANRFGWASYLGELSGSDDVPPTAAPARCEDFGGLPPTFVCVGAVDGFRDEDIEYAMRLAGAGVDVELHVYAGTPHGFRIFGPSETAEQSITDIVRFVKRHANAPFEASPGDAND